MAGCTPRLIVCKQWYAARSVVSPPLHLLIDVALWQLRGHDLVVGLKRNMHDFRGSARRTHVESPLAVNGFSSQQLSAAELVTHHFRRLQDAADLNERYQPMAEKVRSSFLVFCSEAETL